jgi:hypothetical protein
VKIEKAGGRKRRSVYGTVKQSKQKRRTYHLDSIDETSSKNCEGKIGKKEKKNSERTKNSIVM